MSHPFEVGGTYRNEKGEYEVLSIDGPTIQVALTARIGDGAATYGLHSLAPGEVTGVEAKLVRP